MNDDLFQLPSEIVRKRFEKAGAYDESKHPRDNKGRWTAGGVARAALGAGAALVGAAAFGVPGARAVLPGVRRAVLGTRTRSAIRAIERKPFGTPNRLYPMESKLPDSLIGAALANPGRFPQAQQRMTQLLSPREHNYANALRGYRGESVASARRASARAMAVGRAPKPSQFV